MRARNMNSYMTLIETDLEKEFLFFTLATEEARHVILTNYLEYNYEKLKVNITHIEDVINSSELHISTTPVINNLPQ